MQDNKQGASMMIVADLRAMGFLVPSTEFDKPKSPPPLRPSKGLNGIRLGCQALMFPFTFSGST